MFQQACFDKNFTPSLRFLKEVYLEVDILY